jgi:hypothetical protein
MSNRLGANYAQSVMAQRTQEIGIRLALGAPRNAVLWLVSSQGLQLALCRRCNRIRVNGADVAKPGQTALGDFGARPGNTRIGFGNADRYCSRCMCAAARRAAKIDPNTTLRQPVFLKDL